MASPPISSPLKFSVRRCKPQLIVPAKPTLHDLKELSDIDDQEGFRFQLPFIIFFRSHPSMEGKDPVSIIREALGKALVSYYPFAGRLIEGHNRKLIVNCSGEGILFIEADADVTMDQFGDTIQPPYPYIDELLYDVPGSSDILGCPLLLIQVTRLACGGFVFAIRLSHPMSDSYGLAQFLNAVGEFAKGASAPTLMPIWQREILNARNPPRVTCVHHEYDDNSTNLSMMTLHQDNNMVHRSFFFGPKELKSIRKHVPPHLQKCSNFEVLTSFLWRSRTIALRLEPNEVVRLSCTNTIRGKPGKLQLPLGYYGNAFALPAVISKAGLLCQCPLGYALEVVRGQRTKMNEEYIKSVADLMVLKGRPHFTSVGNFLIADVTRAGLAEVDFGWGKPIYGGPTGAIPYIISIFGRFKNSQGEDGIVVPIWLPQQVMDRFEQELLKMTQKPNDDLRGVEYPKKFLSML